ncbi:aldose epimerase family protein [Agromyces silvae]|uniref:hypothetical protein n=1 Tax=Agromyces silvae TaxID=3388266 RepID=UPI00280BFBC0|nr:hypothetical protein [Agromyces protaetiae]
MVGSVDATSVRIDAGRGGRITSLRHAGVEWLSSTTGPSGEPAIMLSGWDEIAPSIAPAHTDSGRRTASHGDLVRAAWTAGDDGWLVAAFSSLHGTFARRATVTSDRIRLDYRIATDDDEALLWAAHPILDWHAGTEIVIEGAEESAWIRVDDPGRPVTAAALRRAVRDLDPSASGKYFLPAEARPSAALVRRTDGRVLRLRWDPDLVPHLGLWLDHGSWGGAPVFAIEPTTGWGDSLDEARAAGRIMRVRPGEPRTWWIEIDVPKEEP